MLSDFVAANREEIIVRCRARVSARTAPRPTAIELEHGIPMFLDQLVSRLLSNRESETAVASTAAKHGSELQEGGFTIAQVINDYGDACQTITEIAIERAVVITANEFQKLNLCLDDAIAGAVTEYQRKRDLGAAAAGSEHTAEDLGLFAHELRNLLHTASLAFGVLKTGNVGISGSTGALLGRSLGSLRDLVDRSLASVRLKAGMASRDRIVVRRLLEEIEISAALEAQARGNRLRVIVEDPEAEVEADSQILASIVANLVQNAFKHTHAGSEVVLRSSATAEHVRIEIEDECGGLSEDKPLLFKPFTQKGSDRSGLGLGLTICLNGAEAIGATLGVRDLPGKGCVFSVQLPRVRDLLARATPLGG